MKILPILGAFGKYAYLVANLRHAIQTMVEYGLTYCFFPNSLPAEQIQLLKKGYFPSRLSVTIYPEFLDQLSYHLH
jgi:hypothetical protein